jgi:MinD superfamily P-loop ATPase
MKELLVISGKGGTGKTSIVACFAALADKAVLADCDVDAADLHLVLQPQVIERHDFFSGHQAVIRRDRCIACGRCLLYCRFGAVSRHRADGSQAGQDGDVACRDCDFCVRSCAVRSNAEIQAMVAAAGLAPGAVYEIDPVACEGCGVCAWFCPSSAIELTARLCGQWMISSTRHGPLVHAALAIAAENSGKLVSTVRMQARELAERRGLETVIIDGSPGIGCPVIASVTGASLVLIVTEPTLSGLHDMERVAELVRHFNIPTMVCVNKWDLNPQTAAEIESQARRRGIQSAGRVRYDSAVTQAQIQCKSVVEYQSDGCAEDIRNVWSAVQAGLNMADAPVPRLS